MSRCRIARRVASMTLPLNARTNGAYAKTLATKVFHYLFQSFLLVGIGRRRGGIQ
jgi:hypothetical protein